MQDCYTQLILKCQPNFNLRFSLFDINTGGEQSALILILLLFDGKLFGPVRIVVEAVHLSANLYCPLFEVRSLESVDLMGHVGQHLNRSDHLSV